MYTHVQWYGSTGLHKLFKFVSYKPLGMAITIARYNMYGIILGMFKMTHISNC